MSSKMKFWLSLVGVALVGAAYASKIRSAPVVGPLLSKLPGADK